MGRSICRPSWPAFAVLLGLAILACWPLASTQAAEAGHDEAFLAGLRARRLFRLAESYCQEQLDRTDLSPARQATLVIELSRTLAEHALQSKPEAAQQHWDQASDVIARFVAQHANHPRLALVQTQDALILLARGELLTQQAAVLANPAAVLEEARTHLRGAIRQLQKLDTAVDEGLRRAGNPKNDDELSEREWYHLQTNIRYQWARAFRNQGLTYPPESPDRTDCLGQATQLLQPLAQRESDEALVWDSRLDLIQCARLQGDLAMAERFIHACEQDRLLPAEFALRVRAERIRLHLAEQQIAKALAQVVIDPAKMGFHSIAYDNAALEATLIGWRTATENKDEAEAALLQKQAAQLVLAIREVHGPYWGRRAATLEASYVGSAKGTTDPAALARAADQFYLGGQLDEAIAGYERAREQALAASQPTLAFELGYKAAAIDHKRQKHKEAAERFLKIALAAKELPRAGEAHLWAIYHTGQLARQAEPPDLSGYEALLKSHLELWPKDPSTSQALLWWGRLDEARSAWEAALDHYRQIAVSDPRFATALEGMQRVAEHRMRELEDKAESTDAWANQCAETFASILTGGSQRYPERYGDVERQLALASARLWLTSSVAKYDQAARVLEAALQGSPDAPAEWLASAQSSLVLALAGMGKHAEAIELLSKTTGGKAGELLITLDGLSQIAADGSPEVRRSLATLQLRSIELLEEKVADLTPAQRQMLDLTFARASAQVENPQKALAIYAALVKTYPKDARMQEEFALLLLEQGEATSLQAALGRWQDLERGSKPGSDRWLRAKYYLALTHFKLGEKEQAAKLIDILEVLHPELGGATWKRRFQTLRSDCRSS